MKQGLFSSESAMWRVNRENFVLIGGAAAAILQVAHPAVAMGVAARSNFRNDMTGRLRRTLEAVYTIAFGTAEDAAFVEQRVRAAHERVRGDHPEPYSAMDPAALMWVLATLVSTSVEMHLRYGSPLTRDDREAFYTDMRVFGRCFGLDPSYGPRSWGEFEDYYRGMIDGPLLGSHPLCAEVACSIVIPQTPSYLRLLSPWLAPLACEYVPEPVRSRLRLPSRRWHGPAVRAFEGGIRLLHPLLPSILRHAPAYRKALARISVEQRVAPREQ